jgi:subtilisin family serine protease
VIPSKPKLTGAAALAVALMSVSPAFSADSRYIVAFSAGRSAAARAALSAAGGRVVLELGPQNSVAAHIPDGALAGLQRNPNIAYIEPDVLRYPFALWNDDVTPGGETTPYGIQMVQADLVNNSNGGSRKVCIIDSGYYQAHEDLKDATTDPSTNDVTANLSNSGSGTWDQDSCGHGSHVAGTISAIGGNGTGVVGVVPSVKLHIVKVFGDDNLSGGNCAWTYSSTLVDALNKCTAAGVNANVVSMSLGGGAKSRTEEIGFKNAAAAGVLSIAAAGNAGNRTTSYPAGYDSVVSVAAVDADENVADFSQRNRDVEIAAPGVSVLSSLPWIETDTLSSGNTTVSGGHIEFSARTPGYTNVIVDGGQCTSTSAVYPAGAIVVCQRGTNSFLEKVNNAKNGGGGAAAIYNNVASDATCGDFAGTLGEGSSSTIPAISLSCADGSAILTQAGSEGTLVSQVTYGSTGGYEAWNGTSMATPHVSGVAALVWSNCLSASAAQIRDALDKTARDKGAAGRDVAYGYGIVQAAAALTYLNSNNLCQ